MRSEGCDDKVRGRRVPGCGRARFRVGRRDYSPRRGHSGRGFNIVVINGMTGTCVCAQRIFASHFQVLGECISFSLTQPYVTTV